MTNHDGGRSFGADEQNDPTEPHLPQIAEDFPGLTIVMCHCTGHRTWNPEEAQAWPRASLSLSKTLH